jgi:hypothetical protein
MLRTPSILVHYDNQRGSQRTYLSICFCVPGGGEVCGAAKSQKKLFSKQLLT